MTNAPIAGPKARDLPGLEVKTRPNRQSAGWGRPPHTVAFRSWSSSQATWVTEMQIDLTKRRLVDRKRRRLSPERTRSADGDRIHMPVVKIGFARRAVRIDLLNAEAPSMRKRIRKTLSIGVGAAVANGAPEVVREDSVPTSGWQLLHRSKLY